MHYKWIQFHSFDIYCDLYFLTLLSAHIVQRVDTLMDGKRAKVLGIDESMFDYNRSK